MSNNFTKLLEEQKNNFGMIKQELNKNKRKTSHWIWYVFPTEKPGSSDPKKTSINKSNYLLAIDEDNNPNLSRWIEIIDIINKLLYKKLIADPDNFNRNSIIPSIDNGRIKYFIKFWINDNGESIKAKNLEFYNTINIFSKVWNFNKTRNLDEIKTLFETNIAQSNNNINIISCYKIKYK